MTAALNALLDANAFVPSPLVDDLIACHVPFDELVKGAAVESAVEERARRGVAVALVGASGSGKSAVTAFALARVSTDFAPIRVPVFYETEQTIKDPGTFARYFLQRLANDAEAASSLDAEERERLLRQASERLTLPARLFGYYESNWGHSIRWTLQAAHEALTEAVAANAHAITEAMVDDAAAAYSRQP